MKRQRNNVVDHGKLITTPKAEDIMMGKKKGKGAVVVVEKVEEEVAESEPAAAVVVVVDNWEEYCWPWLTREVVDEQMSWGYFSLPIWGVEFMDESYGSLFSDVVWDDDIWDLKSIMEIPANT